MDTGPVNEYPVELTPPDIAPYKAGNTGVDWFTTFDSGAPGPHGRRTYPTRQRSRRASC